MAEGLRRTGAYQLPQGGETTVDGVMLRILVHNHEHMGQSIAYARTIGVVPPWSQ
jgi:uncharacterized damage-inducible protein DinB